MRALKYVSRGDVQRKQKQYAKSSDTCESQNTANPQNERGTNFIYVGKFHKKITKLN